MAEPSSAARNPRWGVATWAAAAAYMVVVFDRRWIPHDEGTIGQTAWRILLGELPHRDFDALYTGLLGYVNAGAMWVGGENLLAPRVVLLLAVLAWIPAIWCILRRFLAPTLASAGTLLCVAIGPAIYPAAMPSWYNAFLATFGLLALIRWSESDRARWLVVAGAAAGLSVLFKLTGLYLLAAALFSILHVEVHRARASGSAPGRATGPIPASLVTLAPLGLVALILVLVRSQLGAGAFVHYVVPTLAVGGVAVGGVWSAPRPDRATVARIARGWVRLTAGFAVPVAVFVSAFAAAGAIDDLWRGLFVLPGRRVATAASAPLALALTAGIVVPVGLVVVERALAPAGRRVLALATGAAGLALLSLTSEPAVYRAVWFSLQPLIPTAVLAGGLILLRTDPGEATSSTIQALIPLLWVAALTSLIQFPFSGPIYFAYAAPLGVVAALGAVAVGGSRPTPLDLRTSPTLLSLVILYAVFLGAGPNRGGHFAPPTDTGTVPLALERGRIRVTPDEAAEYTRLVAIVREHARSETIYVMPDAPEVYFLTGLRNPTRTLFEIFDDPTEPAAILELLERHDVDVVVLNTAPAFSPPSVDLARRLEQRYVDGVRVGRFIVRWR